MTNATFLAIYGGTGIIALGVCTHLLRDGRGWSVLDVLAVFGVGWIAGWPLVLLVGFAWVLSQGEWWTKPRWGKKT